MQRGAVARGVGDRVGETLVGSTVGDLLGCKEGATLGAIEGEAVGVAEGTRLEVIEAIGVGAMLGEREC